MTAAVAGPLNLSGTATVVCRTVGCHQTQDLFVLPRDTVKKVLPVFIVFQITASIYTSSLIPFSVIIFTVFTFSRKIYYIHFFLF